MHIVTEDSDGNVVVQDDKSDGTVLVLVCRSIKGIPPTGPTVPPADGPFPLGEQLLAPSTVVLDTTAMPPGRQAFGTERFTRRVGSAIRVGESVVRLTSDNAPEWGWEPAER